MTRREVAHWLGEHWGKALLVAAFMGGLWIARAEAKFDALDKLETDRAVIRGMGRLVCQNDRRSAVVAGIPCGLLLGEWKEVRW